MPRVGTGSPWGAESIRFFSLFEHFVVGSVRFCWSNEFFFVMSLMSIFTDFDEILSLPKRHKFRRETSKIVLEH